MADAGRAQLLRSLGRLARGLSLLFWSLPLSFIVLAQTARTDWFGSLGAWAFAPALVFNGALLLALAQLRQFQRQERIWQNALTRADSLALINAGLAPFVFWWRRFPEVSYYAMAVGLLALSSLLFLMQINRVAQRLAAMIPDENLRAETAVFGAFNIWLLTVVFAALTLWFAAWRWPGLAFSVRLWLAALRGRGLWVILFLTTVPLALTMALLWKIKEVVLAGIFDHAG